MKDKGKLVGAMLIFGTIGAFVKNIGLSSLDIAFLRAVIGCSFLVIAGVFIRQKISFSAVRQNLLLLLFSGAAIGFNWILLFQAYKYTTVANATLSYYFAPLFVILLSPLILKEKITPVKLACILAAIAGLFLILNTGGGLTAVSGSHVTGILYGLSAAALYAGVVLMNKFIKGLTGFETTLIQLFAAALVLVPSILAEGGIPLSSLNTKSLIFIFVVGILHTGFAYFLFFTSMKQIPGQTIAILSYIDPITAVLISAVLLGEPMSSFQILGAILILGSTFLSETGEKFIQGLRKAA